MKKHTIILLLILFSFGNKVMFAQTYKANETDPTTEDFSSKKVENNFLVSEFTTINPNTNGQDNVVFIKQIGDDNIIKTNTRSDFSNLNFVQKGNQNKIYLDVSATIIEGSVFQEGNNNYFLDFSNYGVDYHGAEIVQKGNDQNITWFGGNSISEKLKITMQGDSKTVIVRNFN